MPKKKAAPKKKAKAPSSKGKKAVRSEAFPIVAIGASAGGLEALEDFFSNMPPAPGMAFVIIQHLAPAHKSVMDTLLEKFTDMKVSVIEDGVKVEQNHVYLNQPNYEVAIVKGTLHLITLPEKGRKRLPIDYFFRSLAGDQGERSVCVVLSGTGSDGSLGLRVVKEAGGLAMVQDTDDAKYDGMPASAIATGRVDFVLPVADMPAELVKYAEHPYLRKVEEAPALEKGFTDTLQKIFHLIRRRTGHDFSDYKLNTIRRRLERRMAVHQVDRVEDYFRLLQQNSDEVDALYRDMLITVTNFFRDPDAFKALQEKALRELFEKKRSGSTVRAWVVGCATGEEAYSLAMAMQEVADELGKNFSYQIFATDIDTEAVEAARSGVYAENIVADVSDDRLNRFFVKEGSRYRVKKQVRDTVIFAVQNIIKDPPFSRLDIVSCRNLMIYMTPVLQKKVLPLFHYTLSPFGILFLGTSESIGGFSDLFSAVDTKWKIFKKKAAARDRAAEYHALPVFSSPGPQREIADKSPKETNIRDLAEKIILSDYGPPCVLVNDRFEIVYFQGDTGRFLSPPVGDPSFNILKMARKDVRYKLSTMLHKAVTQKKATVARGLRVRHNGAELTLDLTVRPVVEPASGASLVLAVFDAQDAESVGAGVKAGKKKVKPEEEEVGTKVVELEQELQTTREYLQTTIEDLETSSEELKSTNEELQSTNEELQSTNEELETSKEELQSTNEELETVNTELQSKVEDLSRSNDDLNNLLASTDIATVFLDGNLRVKRFTPTAKRIYNLIESDVGRPIGDIKPRIDYDKITEDSREVLDKLEKKELEAKGDNTWYSMRVLPYRTVENVIDGVVVTFVDITEIKRAEREAEAATTYAEAVINTVREPLLVLDSKLIVKTANRSFYLTFQVTREETEGERIYDLGNGQWDMPFLRKLLEKIIPENATFDDYPVEHDFPGIGKKRMLLNARRVDSKDGLPSLVLLAIEDVTGKEDGMGKGE